LAEAWESINTIAWRKKRMDRELQRAYDTTIEGWMRALALRDRCTGGHSVRVSEMSLALGRELGLKDDELTQLRRGALLHDIGKLGLPDAILNKPERLTETEWDIVRSHPTYGFEILSPIPFLRPAAEIAHCHHENWDGSGYPRGLKGKDIPQIARIVSICNVFDALMTDQPYRRAWNREASLVYIEKQSGAQFDPDLIGAFISFMRSRY
jgi:putative nucleotidyltransferase with HDIG domain